MSNLTLTCPFIEQDLVHEANCHLCSGTDKVDLLDWVLLEKKRAEADSDMATEEDWVSYHDGEAEALDWVARELAKLKGIM